MGQTSISMLNKVGYSMFWNSMWDNKINYSRFLKEDQFINNFFDLFMTDNMSLKVFDLNKLRRLKNSRYLQTYSINYNLNFNKYFKNLNKTNCLTTKIWILRYQKWLILFHFIYIQKNNNFLLLDSNNYHYDYSFNMALYFKYTNFLSTNYNYQKKSFKGFIF